MENCIEPAGMGSLRTFINCAPARFPNMGDLYIGDFEGSTTTGLGEWVWAFWCQLMFLKSQQHGLCLLQTAVVL